jgi:hypothetical protein
MKKTFQFITAIFAFSLLITSCEKDSTDPIDPDPIICVIHITDDITENTTWEASCTYYVDRDIDVTNDAILTIEPGTVIKFAQGMELTISDAGSSTGNIVAVGTKDQIILFTSQAQTPSKGDWDGIWLYTGCNASKFEYCKVEYAGDYKWGSGSGAITSNYANNTAIDYCTFENNDDYGVRIYQNRSALSSFTNNEFIDNTTNDLKLSAFNVSSIGEGNLFSKDIIVEGSDVDAPGDVLWRRQNVPYMVINNDVTVGCSTGTKLIIEAGTSIKLPQVHGIEIAYASSRFGLIEAIGTAKDPITFTSASSNPSKGDWNTIIFYDGCSAGSVFDYCDFSYGGARNIPTAFITFKFGQGSTTTISNCSFSNSEGYGIMLDQPNSDISYPTLVNNSFFDNTLEDKNW